jgi:hypothetical protein
VHDLPLAPVPTKQTKGREKKDALMTSAENNEVTKKITLSKDEEKSMGNGERHMKGKMCEALKFRSLEALSPTVIGW